MKKILLALPLLIANTSFACLSGDNISDYFFVDIENKVVEYCKPYQLQLTNNNQFLGTFTYIEAMDYQKNYITLTKISANYNDRKLTEIIFEPSENTKFKCGENGIEAINNSYLSSVSSFIKKNAQVKIRFANVTPSRNYLDTSFVGTYFNLSNTGRAFSLNKFIEAMNCQRTFCKLAKNPVNLVKFQPLKLASESDFSADTFE